MIAIHATKNVSADPRISELYRANFRNFSCMETLAVHSACHPAHRPVASFDLFHAAPPPPLKNGRQGAEERGGFEACSRRVIRAGYSFAHHSRPSGIGSRF